jgi:hypothetical protein
MSKHTPGPWKLRRAEHSLEHDFILHAGPHIIAWSVPRSARGNTRKKSEHIANAKLIAAAPVLLEALKLAEAALADIGDADREPGDDLAWCEARAAQDLPAIRAAIAKAEAP